MSDIPAKTYPPEFVQAMIADHFGDADKKAAAAPEESSGVQAMGDAMSEIKRFDIPRHGTECMHEDPDGEYVQYDDHQAEMQRLTAERDEVEAEVEQLWRDLTAADGTIDGLRVELAEQDRKLETAQAEIERLTHERDEAQAEVERLRASGQGMLDSSRPTDEDIWREAFMRQLHDDHAPNWATTADLALAEYRKRWPR